MYDTVIRFGHCSFVKGAVGPEVHSELAAQCEETASPITQEKVCVCVQL